MGVAKGVTRRIAAALAESLWHFGANLIVLELDLVHVCILIIENIIDSKCSLNLGECSYLIYVT